MSLKRRSTASKTVPSGKGLVCRLPLLFIYREERSFYEQETKGECAHTKPFDLGSFDLLNSQWWS